MIQELLIDIFTAGLESGSREIKRAARLKRNQNVRPALDVVADFLETLRKEEKRRRRRSPHAARIDRHKTAPSPAAASPDPLRAFVEKAAAFLSEHSGVPRKQILTDRAARERAYHIAAKRLHPDKGGNEADMQQLTAYWRVLKILDEVPT